MFRFLKPLLFAALAVVPAFASNFSTPGLCSGACWSHDPAVIRRTTDGLYFRLNTGKNIEIATSSSIEGPWTLKGFVFTDGSIIEHPGNKDMWAPDLSLVNGVYHLYYTVSTAGSQDSAIGLATSTSLDPGSWSDAGAVGISSKVGDPYNAIDANLIYDGSSYYVNFGSYWGGIFQAKMNGAATKTSGDPFNQMVHDSQYGNPSEGAYIFYYSGYYYLTWSFGHCCGLDHHKPDAGREYQIRICRSESVTGAFHDKDGKDCKANGGSVLLESHDNVYAPGGQGVFADESKGLVLYYHYVDTNVGYGDGQKKFGWNALSWNNGWPSV